jgi:hypothetical protein
MHIVKSNAHFSLTWLYQNLEGVLRRMDRAGVTGFTVTHRGKPLGYLQLEPAAVKPSHAVQHVPDDDGPDIDPPEGFFDNLPPVVAPTEYFGPSKA